MSGLELRVPPLIVVLLIGAAMWWLDSLLPGLGSDYAGRVLVAIAFLVAGIVVVAAALREFRRHATTPDPTRPEKSSAIVTSGIYHRTRNPMYLGMLLLLIAWAVYLTNPIVAPGPIAFILYMNRFQIAPEERALTRIFGESYQAYLGSVRRWI